MMAAGGDALFATFHVVRKSCCNTRGSKLGQMIKFNAADENSFEGPFRMTEREIKGTCAPALQKSYPSPLSE